MYIFDEKNERPQPDRNRNIIIDKLNLDDTQIIKYDSLIKIHRAGIRPAKHHLMELKNNLYDQLNYQHDEKLNDSLIAEINKVQGEIEHIHIRHFQAIKNICGPNQLKAYQDLTTELAKLFTSAPPPKHKK
jgi:hypothetical protein